MKPAASVVSTSETVGGYREYAIAPEDVATTSAEAPVVIVAPPPPPGTARVMTPPAPLKTEADRDWEQLMSLDVIRRPWSAGSRRAPRNDETVIEDLRDEMARVAEAATARIDDLDDSRPHRCR